MKRLLAAVLGLGALCAVSTARAEFPDRPIKFIIPWGAGGSADSLGRLFAEGLAASVGQPVVVENRPGAASNIGSAFVASAPTDGYTLLFTSTAFATNPLLYSSVQYDPVKDFEQVALLSMTPNLIDINPNLPFKTLPDLIAYAKANPGKLNFGSSGNGTTPHITGEMFKRAAGIDIVHVPYKTGTQSLTDLMGGQIQLMFDTTPSSIPYIKAGTLRVLAVAAKERVAELPDVPTFTELGYPTMLSGAWTGVAVPARTPRPIVDRLNREFVKLVADQTILARLRQMGGTPLTGTPEQATAFLRDEIERWGAVIKASGAKID